MATKVDNIRDSREGNTTVLKLRRLCDDKKNFERKEKKHPPPKKPINQRPTMVQGITNDKNSLLM